MTASRSENLMRNASAGLAATLLSIALAFGVRTVFIATLGIEYLGVNGLFTNVLTVLSLAEAGLGAAVSYRLYEPLARQDSHRIAALVNLHTRIYRRIALAVTGAALLLMPFLDDLIRDEPEVDHLTAIYLLFVVGSVGTYFFAPKWSLLITDQRGSVTSRYQVAFGVVRASLQVVVLLTTGSFLLFLGVQVVLGIAEFAWVSRAADRIYPFLRAERQARLPRSDVAGIWSDVRALAVYRFGGAALDGTDAIIISAFVGIAWVGRYSNYTMIVAGLTLLAASLTSALTAGVGSFATTAPRAQQQRLLRTLTFGHFVVHGAVAVCLTTLVNPFIALWAGEDYLLSDATALVVAANWFIVGMMQPVWMFRSTLGLFRHGRWRPVLSAVLNVSISILLAHPLGVLGVLLGTTITRLATNAWFDPLVVYRHGFGTTVRGYLLLLLRYGVTTGAVAGVLWFVVPLLPATGMAHLLLRLVASMALFGAAVLILFSRTEEYVGLRDAASGLAGRLWRKRR